MVDKGKEKKVIVYSSGTSSVIALRLDFDKNQKNQIPKDSNLKDGSKLVQPSKKKKFDWFFSSHKKWFQSPVMLFSVFMIIIISLLIIIPLTNIVTVPFPISVKKNIQFNGTKSLQWDEFYAEPIYLSSGTKLTYSFSASQPFSFAIWSTSIENLPFSTNIVSGSNSGSFTNANLTSIPFFLAKGNSLSYTFTTNGTDGSSTFFITDQPSLNNWDFSSSLNGNAVSKYPNSYYNLKQISSSSTSASFIAPYTQEWYLCWINSQSSKSHISYSINYKISSLDLSQANVAIVNSTSISQRVFKAPTSGTYIFFVLNSPSTSAQQITINYNMNFIQVLKANTAWKQSAPVLTIALLFILLLIVLAVVQRIRLRHISKKQTTITTKSINVSNVENQICGRCGAINRFENYYCKSCGGKLKTGFIKTKQNIAKSSSNLCSTCGSPNDNDSRFCASCGRKIEKILAD